MTKATFNDFIDAFKERSKRVQIYRYWRLIAKMFALVIGSFLTISISLIRFHYDRPTYLSRLHEPGEICQWRCRNKRRNLFHSQHVECPVFHQGWLLSLSFFTFFSFQRLDWVYKNYYVLQDEGIIHQEFAINTENTAYIPSPVGSLGMFSNPLIWFYKNVIDDL